MFAKLLVVIALLVALATVSEAWRHGGFGYGGFGYGGFGYGGFGYGMCSFNNILFLQCLTICFYLFRMAIVSLLNIHYAHLFFSLKL